MPCNRSMCAAIEEKLDSKHNASMLHMMAVLEQEGPAFAERPISTLLGSILFVLVAALPSS